MTRKDYELIAGALRINRHRTALSVAYELADRLKAENPRFDRAKFLLACGVERESISGA